MALKGPDFGMNRLVRSQVLFPVTCVVAALEVTFVGFGFRMSQQVFLEIVSSLSGVSAVLLGTSKGACTVVSGLMTSQIR